jgi:hypothetical protein
MGITICSFAIAGLVAPLQMPAEASGYLSLGNKVAKSDHLRIATPTDGDCPKTAKQLGGTGTDTGCKPDADKTKKNIEPDRKGHKVKKSKGRGR